MFIFFSLSSHVPGVHFQHPPGGTTLLLAPPDLGLCFKVDGYGGRRGRVCRTSCPVGRTTKIGRREVLHMLSRAAKGRRPVCRSSALAWGVEWATLARLGKKPVSPGRWLGSLPL